MQKVIIAKLKTIFLAEVEPERWSAWIRICLSAGYAVLAMYGYQSRGLLPSTFAVQVSAIFFLFAYSAWYLIRRGSKRYKAYIYFVFIGIDVTVVTLILASYALTHSLSMPFRSTLFSAYLVVIMLYALQNRKSLPLLCGFLSIVWYSLLYVYFPLTYGFEGGAHDFLARVSLIVVVSGLSALVSHRNFSTMNKVISSELRYQKLVQRLPEMLFTLDAKGNFLWANTTSYVLLGVPANVIANRNIRDFLTQPDQLKLDKTEYRSTIQIKDFSGALKFADCYIQPIREEGKQPSFEGIMADVTDREIALSQREEMVNRLYQ
ncbi:MAG TPA: PAS domain-containing protein, partial [Chitinivibrionales bacterium]